jgi:hypothetical protein
MQNQHISSRHSAENAVASSKDGSHNNIFPLFPFQDNSEEDISADTSFIVRQQLDQLDVSDINPQAKCPIFAMPLELRWMIYKFVLEVSDHIRLGPEHGTDLRSAMKSNRRALVSTCRRVWTETRRIGISSTPLVLRNRKSLINFNNMRQEDMEEIQHLIMLSSVFGEPLLSQYFQRHLFKSQLPSPRYFTIRILEVQSKREFAYARAWIMMGIKSVDIYVLDVLPDTSVQLDSYPNNEFNASALRTPHCGDYKRLLRKKHPSHEGGDQSQPGYVFAWSRLWDHDTNIKLLEEIGISGLLEWYQKGVGLEEEVDSDQ